MLQQQTNTLQLPRKTFILGWSQHTRSVPEQLLPYWNVRKSLSEADGILFKDNRIMIPQTLRPYVLSLLHKSHVGIEKPKSRARLVVYWPGLAKDNGSLISKCSIYLTYRNRNQKEPMIIHPIPDLSCMKLAADLYELVIVDYFSKFIELSQVRDKTAGTVISHMKYMLARHGIREELVADNVPFNSREFLNFAKSRGFKLSTSSPTYPQSNTMSEKSVQTAKRIFKTCEEPHISLLEYRNIPVVGMSYSPS